MKSLGIIAEFNPFHRGHEYLIREAREKTGADVVICAISGDFVQRGFPASFSKWERAKQAVEHGVNLVVEIPAVYAVNSAEYFAKGGVKVLEGFGCIDYLAFGSESGETDKLRQASKFLSDYDDVIKQKIQALMKQGISHPRAREIAARELAKDFDVSLITAPNNILALEYLRQVKTMEPVTVKRTGAGYHQSAGEIRKELMTAEPEKYKLMEERYRQAVTAKVLQTAPEKLEQIFGAGEGLGNKLKKEIRYASSVAELTERLKSKAYTHTRITRFLTQVLLDIDEKAVFDEADYIRILGFDGEGAKFIKDVKKRECAVLPLLTNINKELEQIPEIRAKIEKDILASDMYNLILGRDLYQYSDYVVKPYIGL